LFQFLSRNSVRWDAITAVARVPDGSGFNSSVGILSVGTCRILSGIIGGLGVSIPQSEFCPLGHDWRAVTRPGPRSFNSSVGILSVGTPIRNTLKSPSFAVSIPQSEFCPLGPPERPTARDPDRQFQFLSRNSVRWDLDSSLVVPSFSAPFQFLSRNSVRWDKGPAGQNRRRGHVSIPQSEFCPLGQTRRPRRRICRIAFQFLSRNSVRWDLALRTR